MSHPFNLKDVTLRTSLCAEISAEAPGTNGKSFCVDFYGKYNADGVVECEVADGCAGSTKIDWKLNPQDRKIAFDNSGDGLEDGTKDKLYGSDLLPNARDASTLLRITHTFPINEHLQLTAVFGDLRESGTADELDNNARLSTNYIGLAGKLGASDVDVRVRNLLNWEVEADVHANGMEGVLLYQRAQRNTTEKKESLSFTANMEQESSIIGMGVVVHFKEVSALTDYTIKYEEENIKANLTFKESGAESPEASNLDITNRLAGCIKYHIDECSNIEAKFGETGSDVNDNGGKVVLCYNRDIKLC